jgi:hypothetical protein
MEKKVVQVSDINRKRSSLKNNTNLSQEEMLRIMELKMKKNLEFDLSNPIKEDNDEHHEEV